MKLNNRNENAANLLKAGDIIVSFDGKTIDAKSTFDELLAFTRPGDIVKLEFIRNGENKTVDIILVNNEGTIEKLKKQSVHSDILGGEFEKISKLEKQTYKVNSGIKVTNITNGRLRQMNIPDGFIFIRINNQSYESVSQLIDKLENHVGQIRIEGLSPSGSRQYLSFTFR